MRAPLATLALIAQLAYADNSRVVTLTLPHPMRTGDTAWLEVKVGIIARGEEIEIATAAGRFLGAISPHGIHSGRDAGAYTIPLPTDAISDDHISLRLSLGRSGHAQRAPTTQEVKSLRVTIVDAAL